MRTNPFFFEAPVLRDVAPVSATSAGFRCVQGTPGRSGLV